MTSTHDAAIRESTALPPRSSQIISSPAPMWSRSQDPGGNVACPVSSRARHATADELVGGAGVPTPAAFLERGLTRPASAPPHSAATLVSRNDVEAPGRNREGIAAGNGAILAIARPDRRILRLELRALKAGVADTHPLAAAVETADHRNPGSVLLAPLPWARPYPRSRPLYTGALTRPLYTGALTWPQPRAWFFQFRLDLRRTANDPALRQRL